MSSSNKSKVLQKIPFVVGILYVALAPALFFIKGIDNAKELVVFFLISGVLLAVLSRFEDVSELGLFGLKAKIERAEQALNAAYATLEQVKEFAQLFAASSLSITVRSGYWGGIPDEQKREILKSTQEGLRKLGCAEQEIEAVSKDFCDSQLFDYRHTLLSGGDNNKIPENDDQECQREWQALRKRPASLPVQPDELMAFFEKYNFMTDENRKRLEGYAYYYKYHEFQDFEDFKNRGKWPSLIALEAEEKREMRA